MAIRGFRRKDGRDRGSRDRAKGGDGFADDSFAMWTPAHQGPSRQGQLVRADVLEATLVSYAPDWDALTSGGRAHPAAVQPLVRLRLRVRADGAEPFEETREWHVPALCLSAVTAGRIVVFVDPTAANVLSVDWSRSALLSGIRSCEVRCLDGRRVDLTGHPDLLLELMRIARAAGGIAMTVDTIDLRSVADPAVVAKIEALAARAIDAPEDRVPPTGPDGGASWIVDRLPGEAGAFGGVEGRWARAGGQLARAQLLEIRSTPTFHYHGPLLKTLLRVRPADGRAPYDVRRSMTVPMNYLALLHRTKQLVVRMGPRGRSFDIDWERTNLLAGTSPAVVISPQGQPITLTGRADPLLAVMRLLASHGVDHLSHVLDLRGQDPAVAARVMDAIPRAPGSPRTRGRWTEFPPPPP
ncbi:hypothetical protein ACFU76_16780 [Streptomyces sp. NPDC057539]|uniref:hypothetical protein n=1 Tax=Streptomyces sp. NPDC057539 TaxID=3346159 RepID=UPI0036BB4CEB